MSEDSTGPLAALRSALSSVDGRAAATASACAIATLVLAVAATAVLFPSVAASGASDVLVEGEQPMATTADVPLSVSDPAWESVPTRTVDLQSQEMIPPYGGGSVGNLDVQAVTNDTHVGFRLSWEDPTNDTSLAGADDYSDAVAVMLNGGERPPITMGGEGTPVNIWYWRAAWEYHAPPESGDMYAYPHPDNRTRPGVAAGNPLSVDTFRRGAQNYYAEGYGSLSHAPVQNVVADARRTEEGWTVTFLRERTTDGQYDADFAASDRMYLAFAVWNGSEGEVNGQKSITLQFSTLDTHSGDLSPPSAGGGGGSGGAGSGDGAGGGGDGASGNGDDAGGGGGLPTTWIAAIAILGIAVATWVGVYRERRRD